MKYPALIIFAVFIVVNWVTAQQPKLTLNYFVERETYTIEGFDGTNPYFKQDGEKIWSRLRKPGHLKS